MRVLFVDDEAMILSGIENALIFAPDDWDATFTNSGEEAIEQMASGFDVLVTDMKMPGLTGADVLEHAKANHPAMVRIVLSGEVDPVLAERAMPLTHEFVSKPCDPDDLFEIIERVHTSSRSLADSSVRDILGSLDSLPSQPALHSRIQDALARGEGLESVARVVESDVAIASSIIKTANSAFYGFKSPTQTVRDAVARLGSETVSGIVLNAEVAGWVTPEMSELVERLNNHSAMVAQMVRNLVGSEVDQAALAGLLHDVGVLVLISQFPEEYKRLQVLVEGGQEPGEELERQIFGASHADIGAYMLELWHADSAIVEAARHHHHPDRAEGPARIIIDAIVAVEFANRPDLDVPEPLADLVNKARELIEGVEAA